jgi:hypothetical protein
MVIKNSTICDKNICRQAAVMINSKDERYGRKKLVFNCVGLVAGMVAVSIMSRQIASTGDYNIWITLPFLAVCAVCLYMGMYQLDRVKYNQIKSDYAKRGITKIDFEVDAEDIAMSAGGKNCICKWKNVTKWTEDANNFYLFIGDVEAENDEEKVENGGAIEETVDGEFANEVAENTSLTDFVAGDCIIISKKGFTQCTAKDMKQLCGAIMQARREN